MTEANIAGTDPVEIPKDVREFLESLDADWRLGGSRTRSRAGELLAKYSDAPTARAGDVWRLRDGSLVAWWRDATRFTKLSYTRFYAEPEAPPNSPDTVASDDLGLATLLIRDGEVVPAAKPELEPVNPWDVIREPPEGWEVTQHTHQGGSTFTLRSPMVDNTLALGIAQHLRDRFKVDRFKVAGR